MEFKPTIRTVLCFVLIQVFLLTGASLYADQNPTLDRTTRLAALAKTWGLLKYYHPQVAGGDIDWDAVLINAVPAVQAAEDFDSFNQEINNLILEAGDVNNADYNPGVPAQPNEDLFKWIKDKDLFSDEVRDKLTTVQLKRAPGPNHYVQYKPNSNALFYNEKPYFEMIFPTEGYRLLALFRYWNVIQYFAPNKDIIDQDWDQVLERFIPRFIAAGDVGEYSLLLLELVASIKDGHGFTSSAYIYNYWPKLYPPFEVRHIESRTVVTRVYATLLETEDQVQLGDILVTANNKYMETFKAETEKYIAVGNESCLHHELGRRWIRGDADRLIYTVIRNGQSRNIDVPSYTAVQMQAAYDAEQNQLTKWEILPGNIGYVHMGVLEREDVDAAMADLMGTQGIVLDVRNYPKGTVYAVNRYLMRKYKRFAKLLVPDPDAPGSFFFKDPYYTGPVKNTDSYQGRVVVLADERTVSHAEFTCMALQAGPDTTIVGSQTAGADGNATWVFFPGGVYTYFTGLGIFYPDNTPTQRIGIVPDIHCRPTIAGVADGQDEVLQRAIDFIENN